MAVTTGEVPAVVVSREGHPIFRLPAVAGLSTPEREESLSHIQVHPMSAMAGGGARLDVVAESSLWSQRSFEWLFYPDRIEFRQHAGGSGRVARCYFFSNGISDRWTNGTSPGVAWNTTVFAERYFSPRVNHADQFLHTVAVPQALGVGDEAEAAPSYDPEAMDNLFVPPPLALSFSAGELWTSIGIGTSPGDYQFNGFEYTGSRYAGASFYVNYAGSRTVDKGFASPVAVLHFGFDEYDTLRQYVDWIDARGFGTARRFPNAAWHSQPIFCGWAEQTVEAADRGIEAHDLATERDYEAWIAELEVRHLPFGTIVIDDKWQAHYGGFDVDAAKWPDLKGFIDRQHARGRHVLLWVPGYHREGVPTELCVTMKGQCVAGDPSNPAYEAFLRERIRHLVADLGVDGFKEDWVGGLPVSGDLRGHGDLRGIEFVRRFQFILYDEAHKWKPDALVETQTPNPVFRESSDVLRLNDVWYGSRGVPAMMRIRARIAHIAGWPLVDTDNASSTTLDEWWAYMRQQPSIGIPALYFVHRTESTKETVPDEMWQQLAAIWERYLHER